jgi:hypothetical protein
MTVAQRKAHSDRVKVMRKSKKEGNNPTPLTSHVSYAAAVTQATPPLAAQMQAQAASTHTTNAQPVTRVLGGV